MKKLFNEGNQIHFFLSVYFNKHWNFKNKTLHIIYTYM